MPARKNITTFKARAWARGPLSGLQVTGDLFGSKHVFRFRNRQFHLTVPNVQIGEDFYPVEAHKEVASLCERRSADPAIETTWYEPAFIEIYTDLENAISAPAGIFSVPNNAFDLVGKQRASRNTNLVKEYDNYLADAFDHWQRIVRWITGSSELGAPLAGMRLTSPRMEFTRVLRVRDGKTYWAIGGFFEAMRRTRLDAEAWRAVESALTAGFEAPVWFTYLDEAHHRLIGSDFTGALLSSAIACETVARQVLWFSAGATEDAVARDLVDRVAAQTIVGRWAELTGLPKAKTHVGDVHTIFDRRNKLVHIGGANALDEQTTKKLTSAARTFVCTADEWLSTKQSLRNPRLFR